MLDTQNCLQNHIKNAKATKFLIQSAFYTSKGRTCKVLPFYDFWFKFYNKFCSPYWIVDVLRIFNHQKSETVTLRCLFFVLLPILLQGFDRIKLQLHDEIYRLRFYSNSLIHILPLSNSHNNVASLQKNRGDKL